MRRAKPLETNRIRARIRENKNERTGHQARHRPQSAQDYAGPALRREMHKQVVEGSNLDLGAGAFGDRSHFFAHHVHAILDRKHRLLAGVGCDADDQDVDQPRRARDDIHMTVGERVERAGVHANAFPGHRPKPPALVLGCVIFVRTLVIFFVVLDLLRRFFVVLDLLRRARRP